MVKAYSFINAFRALAAFWVLTAHCMIWGGWYGIPLPSAKIAVDLFMMISGFLMAAKAFERDEKEPLTSVRNWCRFWLRRFFRLAPSYYLSLLLVILGSPYFLSGLQELQQLNPEQWANDLTYDPTRIEYTPQNILLHLSFLFGVHPKWSFSTFLPDWSLSLEMQFYLAFPVLILFMRKNGFFLSAVVLGLASFILAVTIRRFMSYDEPSLLFFKLQYFIVGILVFSIVNTTTVTRKKILQALCAIALVSLETGYGKELIVLPLLACSLMLFGWWEKTKRMPGWLADIIRGKLVRFASDTSYGVYLFHSFFISAMGLILSKNAALMSLTPKHRVMLMFIFVPASSYLLAYFVFRWIESPGILLGKHIQQRLMPARIHANCEEK